MNELTNNDFYILANSQLFPVAGSVVNEFDRDINSEALVLARKAYDRYQIDGAATALSLYTSAIEQYPQQPFFYAARALLNRELGDEEGAYYDYQVAKGLDFNYHHFLEWKDNAGEMVEAEELLELHRQLMTQSTDPQPYVNRAMLHVQHYCYQEAVEDFARAYELQPNPEYLLSSAAVYMRMLRYAQALQQLNAAVQAESALLDAYLYRGKLYAAVHEKQRAEEDLNYCIAQQADNKLYLEERAGFYEKHNRLDDAIADYSQLVALDSEDFFPYVMRADLYEKTGELQLAIGDYDRAIALNPYYSDLYDYRASLKEQIGDTAGAAQDRVKYEELEQEE